MLPSTIVGSVTTSRGNEPFVLDTPTGRVTTGKYREAHHHQAQMARDERSAAETQVRAQLSGVKEVRLGQYQCPKCQRWVDVVKDPAGWSGSKCARC
jgi:hypothetical protein